MRRVSKGLFALAMGGALTSGPMLAFEGASGTVPSWRTVASPSRQGDNGLSAVSCSSPTFCVAVGTYVAPKSGPKTLVERWDGQRWSILASPNATDPFGSQLNGVSCT